MGALSMGGGLTVAELVRREDPDGSMAELVDMISEENHILDHITWIECNNGTFHEDKRTVSEPSGAERAYDEGIAGEAGVTEVVTERTCMLNGLSEVDASKLKHSNDEAGQRLMEDAFFLRGMTKTLVNRLFNGNRATYPKQINGINTRADYNDLDSAYVFDNAGGNASSDSNKTSVYFIQFGAKMVNLIYPRHDPTGGGPLPIKMEDFGKSIINQTGTSETKKYPAWQTWFSANFGIFIHDPRCIKRIVNISTTAIDGVDDFAWHEDPMIDAYHQLEYNGAGCVILCNRTVLTQAHKRSNEKGNAFFTTEVEGEGPFARPVTRFMGIAMERVDQITDTQATVTT